MSERRGSGLGDHAVHPGQRKPHAPSTLPSLPGIIREPYVNEAHHAIREVKREYSFKPLGTLPLSPELVAAFKARIDEHREETFREFFLGSLLRSTSPERTAPMPGTGTPDTQKDNRPTSPTDREVAISTLRRLTTLDEHPDIALQAARELLYTSERRDHTGSMGGGVAYADQSEEES